MPLHDVVIFGAGLAGLQCARLLGAVGLRVVLLDRKPSLSASVHTTGIFVRRTLEDFDLPADCLGPPVRHVTLYSPALRGLELESPHAEFRVGKMPELYERFLAEAMRAGVIWMSATRCVYVEPGSPVRIRIEHEGRREILLARFVIAADGAQSRAARYLGLDVNSEFLVGVEDVLRGVPLSGPPRFHCLLGPDIAPGYIAWLVNDGEEAHLGVGGYAHRFDPVSALEKLRNRLADIADFRHAERIERRGGLIPVGGVLRRLVNRYGLLVGDAAGAVSPLTAGGLDPAMRLSTLAANVAAQFLSAKNADDNADALARYSGEHFRARFVSRLWMRQLLSTLRSPLLIEAGCALLRLPGPRHLAWHVFFGRGSFPDLPGFRLSVAAPVAEDGVQSR